MTGVSVPVASITRSFGGEIVGFVRSPSTGFTGGRAYRVGVSTGAASDGGEIGSGGTTVYSRGVANF